MLVVLGQAGAPIFFRTAFALAYSAKHRVRTRSDSDNLLFPHEKGLAQANRCRLDIDAYGLRQHGAATAALP